MANLKVPNLCGASPEFNAIQLEFENLIDDAVNKLEAEASAAVATATTIFNSLDTELKNLVPEIPELPDINLQSELVSLTALTPGTFEHTQLLAKIATDFEDALTTAGYELSTLVANALESISAGKDLCSVVPNFEKPAVAGSEAKEKAVESKQATIDSVEEALSVIVPNAHIDDAKAALTTAINLFKTGVPFPTEQENAYTIDVAGNPNLVSGTTPPTEDVGAFTVAKESTTIQYQTTPTRTAPTTFQEKEVKEPAAVKVTPPKQQGGKNVTTSGGFTRVYREIVETITEKELINTVLNGPTNIQEFKLKHKPVRVNWLKGNLIIHIRIPRRTGKLRDRQVQRTIHPERIKGHADYEINGSTIKVRQNGNYFKKHSFKYQPYHTKKQDMIYQIGYEYLENYDPNIKPSS